MSDIPGQPDHTDSSYPPSILPPKGSPGWVTVLGPVTALLAVGAIVLIGALALRDRHQADDSLNNLRERAAAAEADRDANQASIDCMRREGGESLTAIAAALRADSELVIETAEQVDALLRGEPVTPDALRAQIENVRAAWGVVDRLNIRYAEVIIDCED